MPYNLYIYIPRVASIPYVYRHTSHQRLCLPTLDIGLIALVETFTLLWPPVWMSATAYLVCQVEGRRVAGWVFSAYEERTSARVMIEAMQSTTSHHPRVVEDVRLGSSVNSLRYLLGGL